jgi:hypothetical protein
MQQNRKNAKVGEYFCKALIEELFSPLSQLIRQAMLGDRVGLVDFPGPSDRGEAGQNCMVSGFGLTREETPLTWAAEGC